MPIPEAQLETWSHQGSVRQSSDTYQTIRGALFAPESAYVNRTVDVFLQGSYGNDTNIYAESDVDVVIRLDSTFQHDLTGIPTDQQAAFKAAHSDATYLLPQFKSDVVASLTRQFGSSVVPGNKAIAITADGNRRKADVIAALQFRRYTKFLSMSDQAYAEGICFYNTGGQRIINYPKLHSKNCTTKHQETSSRFKPFVRVMKNIRSTLYERGEIQDGQAPSYFIEGMLYNVPNSNFAASLQDTLCNSLNWLRACDQQKLVCANFQSYLLHGDPLVTWNADNMKHFLDKTVQLWNSW